MASKPISGAEGRRRKAARQVIEGALPIPRPAAAGIDLDAFRDLFADGDDRGSVVDEAISIQREAMRQSIGADGNAAMALERTARIAAMVVKSADPKAMLDAKDEALRQAHEDIEALEARVKGGTDAVQIRPRDHGGLGEAPQH